MVAFINLIKCIDRAVQFFSRLPLKDLEWKIASNPYYDSQTYSQVAEQIIASLVGNDAQLQAFKNSLENFFFPTSYSKAVLLFLISWNIDRFKRLLEENKQNLNQFLNYLTDFEKGIQKSLAYKIPFIRPHLAFYRDTFQKVRDDFLPQTFGKEHIPTAKLLMVLNPHLFIAWDNQIAPLFGLNPKNPEDFAIFNILVSNFINRNKNIAEYLESKYEYPIRRILDMILYIYANKKLEKEKDFSACAIELINLIQKIY